MTPRLRKLTLTAHVTASVGWLGALAVFLAHALASLVSQDEQMVRAASLAMGLTAWFVILPLSLASLITGLVQALGTAWGLFRHYWILFKLLLTAVATIVLLLKLEPISYLADVATQATFSSADLIGLRTSLMVHAAGGLLVLLAAAALAVYKPPGMTRYGVRKQREQDNARVGPGPGSAVRTPRWVKVFGTIVIVLILLVGIMMLFGGHGPGAHLS
jgi:predicted secreted protein